MKKNILVVILIVAVIIFGLLFWKKHKAEQDVQNIPAQSSQTDSLNEPAFDPSSISTETITSIGGHITIKNIKDPLVVTSHVNNHVILSEIGFNGPSVIGTYNNVPYMQVWFFENQSKPLCDFLNQVGGIDASYGSIPTNINGYPACKQADTSTYVVSSADGKNIAGFNILTPGPNNTPQDYSKLLPYWKAVMNSVTFN